MNPSLSGLVDPPNLAPPISLGRVVCAAAAVEMASNRNRLNIFIILFLLSTYFQAYLDPAIIGSPASLPISRKY
jgi:hypothetical protein